MEEFTEDFKNQVLGVVQNDKATSVCIRIHKDLRKKLKEYCIRSCLKESGLVSKMIYDYLEESIKKENLGN